MTKYQVNDKGIEWVKNLEFGEKTNNALVISLDAYSEYFSPIPEPLKRGDLVRFKYHEAEPWKFGSFRCFIEITDAPFKIITGSGSPSICKYCEPYNWTAEDIRKLAMDED